MLAEDADNKVKVGGKKLRENAVVMKQVHKRSFLINLSRKVYVYIL